MTAETDRKPAVTRVAIDIAKRSHAVLVELPGGEQKRFRMASSADDHDRLIAYLKEVPHPVIVALEPTGDCHRTLAHRLLREGHEVCLVSALAGARYREAIFNSWDKNDPKDAGVIMALLKQGMTQRYIDPLLSGNHGLQELSKTYYQISTARTRLQHSLMTHYLPLYFPEVEHFFHTSQADWFSQLLLRFPTAASIRRVGFERFKEEAWPLAGRKVNKSQWMVEVYEAAMRSIGLDVADDSIEIETYRLQLQRYQDLIGQRDALADRADKVLRGRPDYESLRSIPGDVPPQLSSGSVWNPIPVIKEIGREEAVQRRADHRFFEGSGRWRADQGAVPTARLLGRQLLPVAKQVWRHGRVGRQAAEGVGG